MKKIFLLLVILSAYLDGLCQSNATLDSAVIEHLDSLVKASKSLWYSDTDLAKVIAEEALEYSKSNSYLTGEGRALSALGSIYNVTGDDVKSVAYFKEAADLFQKDGNELYSAMIRSNIAVLLIEDEQYKEALAYTQRSYDYFKENDLLNLTVNSYSAFGVIYIKTQRGLDEIMEKLDEGDRLARVYNDTLQLVQLLNSKGIAHVEKGVNLNFAITQFKEAIDLLKRKDKNDNFIGLSYLGLGETYLKLDALDQALVNNDIALQNFQKMGYVKGLHEAYESRKKIFEAKKDYKSAFEADKMYDFYNDSLYSKNKASQLNKARLEYDTDRKESEIASLSQQASIQALEIKQKNQALIIGVVVFLFVIAAIFFVYKQRETKKQQSQTELEQRFLRSQLNPHFISNALVAVQSFMLKSDSESAALYLTKFSKLMREILENSRKEFIPVEEEVSMLKNYLDIHKSRLVSLYYSIDLDENIDPEVDTIPPMFVQPFVENAIEHGIANLDAGKIELRFKKDGDYISIAVSDNGSGISMNKKEGRNSLSTRIIKERMDLFNKSLKNKIQLILDDIKDKDGEIIGTKVQLKVPFSYI
ncbi:MAG: histidine kinase [Ekhidna sp.]